MEVQVELAFDQLLRIVKTLPEGQLKLLKAEIESEVKRENISSQNENEPHDSLTKGSVATKKPVNIVGKKARSLKTTGSLDDIFGLWKDKNINLNKIREQQWRKEIK